MDDDKLTHLIATLPEPDLMVPHMLTDPVGANMAYRAHTVARLIDEAVKAERERCAQLAESGIAESDPGPYNNACRNIAAAIRGGKTGA